MEAVAKEECCLPDRNSRTVDRGQCPLDLKLRLARQGGLGRLLLRKLRLVEHLLLDHKRRLVEFRLLGHRLPSAAAVVVTLLSRMSSRAVGMGTGNAK